jgi:phosphoglycolate phosphatase-like HAD superfamily hydrolase
VNIFLFDIDGTLINSGGAGKAAMERALASEFDITKVQDGVACSGRTDRAIARDLFKLHGIDETPDCWSRFVSAYLQNLPETLRRYPGRVLPGIVSLLERLGDSKDRALGLLTGNLRHGARLKLTHYGLFRHFSFGGYGDEHLERDDVAREAFQAASSYLGSSSPLDAVWVIGDTPLDVSCARAIGARVVAVATGWHSREELEAAQPDMVLTDFNDPRPLLALCR